MRLMLVGPVVMGLAGCRTGPKPMTLAEREAVYHRAEATLPRAILFKPLETVPTNRLAWVLAPLFLQETLLADAAAVPGLVPTVWFRSSQERIRGRMHEQLTYWWPPLQGEIVPSGEPGWQAVRLTLDADGLPAIWEALPSNGSPGAIFVSRQLETAAQAEWGGPLPGRRFAVERALRDAPGVVVVRVLDDTPVPLGPLIHLRASNGRVSSVLCRCMPTQVRELVGTMYYQLRPAEARGDTLSATGHSRGDRPPPRWPESVPLERRLRLPSRF